GQPRARARAAPRPGRRRGRAPSQPGGRMKKALLALLGAVLLLAGVFGVKKARESLDARPRLAFADARLEDAVRLGIRYAGDSVTLALAESGWIVTADSFPADTARLRRAFGHLAELQTRERAA